MFPTRAGRRAHLSCGFHALPDAEVAHGPGDEQAHSQVPVQRAHLVDAWGNPQRSSPVGTKRSVTRRLQHRQEEASEQGNSLPELHDRRGGIEEDRLVDGGVSPLELNAVFCGWKQKQRKNRDVALIKRDSD